MAKIFKITLTPLEVIPMPACLKALWDRLLLTGLILLFFGIVPITAQAATLYLSPTLGNHYQGGNFEVHILVSSDKAINAVSGVLSFPTKYLKVIEINKQNSILNFWVEEPSFSNAGESGNIRFEGVVLNPGFTGNGGRVANIFFRADGIGAADVSFTQSSILANDGLGTNILNGNSGASFTVLPPKPIQTQTQAPESAPQTKVVVVNGVQQEKPSAIVSFWEVLPNWVKASVIISIGLSTLVILLIVLSFGIIVLIWLWANIWHLKTQFFALVRLPVHLLKNFVIGTLSFLGIVERTIKEDLKYSLDQLIKEIKKAPQTPSFRSLLKDWFLLVSNIVKHFFTKDNAESSSEILPMVIPENPSEHKQDLNDANKQNLNNAEKFISGKIDDSEKEAQ